MYRRASIEHGGKQLQSARLLFVSIAYNTLTSIWEPCLPIRRVK